MNGAQALVATLRAAGVSVCFANPGTSELGLVAALGGTPGIRGVLCLFEGVATGAADGFGRMSAVPATALLHQGVGLANGLAGLHNAGRAHTPVVAIVGAGARSLAGLGAPLESDVAALARPMSCWVGTATDAATIGADGRSALAAAGRPPGGVATLIVPSDVADSPGGQVAPAAADRRPADVSGERVRLAARTLAAHGRAATLLIGGPALRAPSLAVAARIATTTGARVFCEAFPARLQTGAGLAAVPRMSSDADRARRQLAGSRHLLLAGAATPVAAFARPDQPGRLAPPDCHTHVLADPGQDAAAALAQLADLVGPAAPAMVPPCTLPNPATGNGALTPDLMARTVAGSLPEGAIVVEEANTCGPALAAALARGHRIDLLTVSGFALGQGLPLSVGAALACPDRRVVCLEADGSAMYTLSALWTQAREGLDITTIVLANRAYQILRVAAARAFGAGAATVSSPLFDLSDPAIDFVSLAQGMGVPASRATSPDALTLALRRAVAEPGPHLIEAVLTGTPPTGADPARRSSGRPGTP